MASLWFPDPTPLDMLVFLPSKRNFSPFSNDCWNFSSQSAFHKRSPAFLVQFDLISGYRIGSLRMLSSLNTSTGNNLHGIQIFNNTNFLYPLSTTNSSGSIISWGIGCFDIVMKNDCIPNGGYTLLGPQTAFSPPVFSKYTGIYGLISYGGLLYTVDQDNFLYCYDPSILSACVGWTPYNFTDPLFPWLPALDNSEYAIDILPNSSRLYILRNIAAGAFQLRCLDLSLSPLGNMGCSGFQLPAVFENLYVFGNYSFMLYFLQMPTLSKWYVCSSSYKGAQGCVDAFTGVTIVDIGLGGTYAGVPAALASSFNSTTSSLPLFQGLGSYGSTGKFRTGNKTYFSGIGRNGVICWDDSTYNFCLNSTGQSFAQNASFPGLLFSGLETRDYQVSFDAVSGCFFSLGDADQPWSFDADGNIPCQSSNPSYSITLVDDFYEIPQNGTAQMNITSNDLPSGKINQASVSASLPFSNYTSFLSSQDSFGNMIFTFVSQPSTCGNFNFSYSACGLTSTASAQCTIHINCPPTGVPDIIFFFPGSPSTTNVVANDADPDLPRDSLTIASISTAPSHGTATISSDGQSIFYTPNAGSLLPDSLAYIVQDKFNQTAAPTSVSILPLIPILLVSQNATPLSNGSFQSFSATEGSSSSTTFTLANNGLETLNVVAINLPTGYSTNQTLPLSILAGQSSNLSITFSPLTGGSYVGPMTLFSNDPQNPSYVININGTAIGPSIAISLNGSTLSNGQIIAFSAIIGVGQTQTFLINNTGNQNLTISSASTAGTGYSITPSSLSSTVLTAGQTLNVSVTLNTTFAIASSGSLLISSNDQSNPLFYLWFNGLVSGPQLQVSENQLSVSNGGLITSSGPLSKTLSQNVTIKNSGNQNLTLTSVAVSGVGYSIIIPVPTSVLTPGQSMVATIIFSASSTTGIFNGSLIVTSNDPVSPAFTATISTAVVSPIMSVSSAGGSISNGGSLVFPPIPLGQANQQQLNFGNSGTSPLTISSLSIPIGFSLVGGNVSLIGFNVINPGQTLVLILGKDSFVVGQTSGTLQMNTNDPNNSIFSVNLSGWTGQGSVTIGLTGSPNSSFVNGSPNSILLLPHLMFSALNTSINITNTNNLSSLVIFPTSVFPVGYFAINPIPSAGLSIGPGQSISFAIGVDTTISGQLNGTILLRTSDPSNPTFSIAISSFVFFWNFSSPLSPDGQTKWHMYLKTTINWAHNLPSHTLSLHLLSEFGVLSMLSATAPSSTPFSFHPYGIKPGNYAIKAVISIKDSQFISLNGATFTSPMATLKPS